MKMRISVCHVPGDVRLVLIRRIVLFVRIRSIMLYRRLFVSVMGPGILLMMELTVFVIRDSIKKMMTA